MLATFDYNCKYSQILSGHFLMMIFSFFKHVDTFQLYCFCLVFISSVNKLLPLHFAIIIREPVNAKPIRSYNISYLSDPIITAHVLYFRLYWLVVEHLSMATW